MAITATELKANLGRYLSLAEKEDIFITQYGKVVAKLTSPFQDRLEMAESLFGSALGEGEHAAVARGHVEAAGARRGGELAEDGVLAAAGPQKKDVDLVVCHVPSVVRCVWTRLPPRMRRTGPAPC